MKFLIAIGNLKHGKGYNLTKEEEEADMQELYLPKRTRNTKKSEMDRRKQDYDNHPYTSIEEELEEEAARNKSLESDNTIRERAYEKELEELRKEQKSAEKKKKKEFIVKRLAAE